MSAASARVHDQSSWQFIHSSSALSGVCWLCSIYHVLSLCVRCILSLNTQSNISNELYILIQSLFHISVIPSLCSFPSQPGAECNCCSSLLTLNVYTNESLIWQWVVTQLIIMFKCCEIKHLHIVRHPCNDLRQSK